MIAILDYDRGNIFSIEHALGWLGISHTVTSDPDQLLSANGVVLPGVGAFSDAMKTLSATGLDDVLKTVAASNTPLLGICLGMQLLFDEGDEFGTYAGLGLVDGRVERLPTSTTAENGRIPNVGWRPVSFKSGDDLFSGIDESTMYYFVHSYRVVPSDTADVIGTIQFDESDIAALIRRGNIIGCQFHPERSGRAGLDILRRFSSLVTN